MNCWQLATILINQIQYVVSFDCVDFWLKIYQILYPSLVNSITHITVANTSLPPFCLPVKDLYLGPEGQSVTLSFLKASQNKKEYIVIHIVRKLKWMERIEQIPILFLSTVGI